MREIHICLPRNHQQYREYFIKHPPEGVKGHIIQHWGLFRPLAEFTLSRCDLLYANNCQFPDLFFARNKPMIADLEGHFSDYAKKNMDRLVGNPRLKKVIFNTDWAYNDALKYLKDIKNRDKLEPPCPAVATDVQKRARHDDNEIWLLFIGEDFYRKSGDLIVDAFAELQKKYDNLKLILVSSKTYHTSIEKLAGVKAEGYFWDKNIPEIRKNKGIVYLHKWIPDEKIRYYYENSDIFLFPTKWETFGFCLLEAMAHSLPIITSDVDPIPEVVGEDAALFLNFRNSPYKEMFFSQEFRKKTINDLVGKLSLLIEDKQLRAKMGGEGRTLAEGKYSLEKRNKRMKEICEEAVGWKTG